VLRIWLIVSGAVIAGLAIWAFAPVLVFLALLAAGLGMLSLGMIMLARKLQAWRESRDGDPG
jgi:hypothetical protein